jgi:hypothetical protein
LIGVGLVVAVVVVLLTGLVWPGWFGGPSTVTAACPLLSASDVEQTFGTNGLTSQEQGPIYDHGTPVYMCTYAGPNGTVDVVLSVADYPATMSPDQLVRNTESSGSQSAFHQRRRGLRRVRGSARCRVG